MAKKYFKKQYDLEVINGCELDDGFLFTAGNKQKPIVGNPRIMISKATCEIMPATFSLKQLLEISKKAEHIEIKGVNYDANWC